MTGSTITPAARELPLEPGGTVEILVSAGDLRIRGTDADRVVVRSRDGAPLGDEISLEAEPGLVRVRDGQWSLRLGPLSLRGRRSRDLDIDLPRGARVHLRTMSGDVDAAGIAAPSRWASASGDLRISTAAGPVQVETMSGDVVVEASVEIDLGARSVSGDLTVRAPRLETTDVGTTSGDIRIEAGLVAGGRHAVRSVSGDVEIATASPVRLEAQTIAGDVRAQGAHHAEGRRGQRTLVVGSGSVGLSVRTTSGDVRLEALGAGRAEPVVPRFVDDEDTRAWSAPQPLVDRREAARLDILRALERGELDIETASRRLEILEDAGPQSFRGWC